MKIFLNVKTALWISFTLLLSAPALAEMEIIPQLSCGEYLVRGRLKFTDSGDFILKIRDQSSSPFEFILLGGGLEDKLDHNNSLVLAKVLVEKKIKSNHQPFVKLISFVKETKEMAPQQDYILLKARSCQ